jgi:hypothetical protein
VADASPAGVGAEAAAPLNAPQPACERPVVPPEQARLLFRISFLTLASLAVAAWLRVYDGVVVCALVFLFSVNHWRRPVYGVRRWADIANTLACLGYQTWRATRDCTLMSAFLVLTYAGVACFVARLWLVAKHGLGPAWGARLHCGVHVLGNAGNVCLYVGVRNAPLIKRR